MRCYHVSASGRAEGFSEPRYDHLATVGGCQHCLAQTHGQSSLWRARCVSSSTFHLHRVWFPAHTVRLLQQSHPVLLVSRPTSEYCSYRETSPSEASQLLRYQHRDQKSSE